LESSDQHSIFTPLISPIEFQVSQIQLTIITKENEQPGIDSVALRGTLHPPHKIELIVNKCNLFPMPTQKEEDEEGFDVFKEAQLVYILPMSKKSPELECLQWAKQAEVSTFYDEPWGPAQLQGPPKVFPSYGDIKGAWAAKQSTGTNEFLILHYENEVHVSGIFIFETNHPGYVSKVSLMPINQENWIEVWSTPQVSPAPKSARIFEIPFQIPTPFKTKSIKIDINCTTATSWVEIDCVALRGYQNLIQK